MAFTQQDINFVRRIKYQGTMDQDDRNQMKEIYQRNINPDYDHCDGCPASIKTNFNNLVSIMRRNNFQV